MKKQIKATFVLLTTVLLILLSISNSYAREEGGFEVIGIEARDYLILDFANIDGDEYEDVLVVPQGVENIREDVAAQAYIFLGKDLRDDFVLNVEEANYLITIEDMLELQIKDIFVEQDFESELDTDNMILIFGDEENMFHEEIVLSSMDLNRFVNPRIPGMADLEEYDLLPTGIHKWGYPPYAKRFGKNNLLTILWDPGRVGHTAATKQYIEKLIFGPDSSVKEYFKAQSNGQYELTNAGILGWYDAVNAANHYWLPKDEKDTDGDGFISNHTKKRHEAIQLADPAFDFSKYDFNKDGKLDARDELAIMIVIPQANTFGTNRWVVAQEYPSIKHMFVDGIELNVVAEAYLPEKALNFASSGHRENVGLIAHELAHLMLEAPDEYFTNMYFPYAAGSYSLMDQHGNLPSLDPYLKMRNGWITPKVIKQTGCYPIVDQETNANDIYLIYDPINPLEFFLIENRQKGQYFDSMLADPGLGIWNISEDKNMYSKLSAPYGVDATKWNKIEGKDWGRRGIRLLRSQLYPLSAAQALWENGDLPALGYYDFKWINGSYTGVKLTYVSNADKLMEFCVEIPAYMEMPVVK
ncbi:MAG: M6 family metalloprotease domain-containing protein [bacterium]|nr:immune inhibitor A [bacterium]MBU1918990.1 immune inhibitor A [bacterium]